MQTRSSSSPSPSPDHRRESQLQIVDPNSFRGKTLPGWTVVNRPRSSSTSSNVIVDTEIAFGIGIGIEECVRLHQASDFNNETGIGTEECVRFLLSLVQSYYIEPGSGRQFSSLEAVQRHLTGEVNEKRLTRAGGAFFQHKPRVYEGSETKEDRSGVVYASKGFQLPRGWSVEEVPRKNTNHIDKYYVEGRTGKRFRSLVSVERYLKESKNRTDQPLMLLQYHRSPSKDFRLPDGWIVEEKPRRNTSHIDRSYIEPGTGNKFRSMAAVERYLLAVENSVSMMHSQRLSLAVSRFDTRFQNEVIGPNPHKKVKWVLTGPGGNMFAANVSGSDVSSSVKQTWSEAFVSVMQDRS